jgi:hypothetical protein
VGNDKPYLDGYQTRAGSRQKLHVAHTPHFCYGRTMDGGTEKQSALSRRAKQIHISISSLKAHSPVFVFFRDLPISTKQQFRIIR